MKIFKIKAIAFTGLFLGLTQTSAVGFTLDAFSDYNGTITFFGSQIPGQEAEASGGTILQNQLVTSIDPDPCVANTLSNVFGGCRTLQIATSDLFNQGDITLQANQNITGISPVTTDPNAGTVAFSVASNTTGRAEIIYDGFNGTSGFEDITDGGVQDSIVIDVDNLNLGNGNDSITLNFDVQDTSGNTGTISRTITSNLTDVSLPFLFEGGSGTDGNLNNVSLDRVNYIRLYTSNENIGDDFTFSFLQTSKQIPFEFSPGLGLILGSGFFSFLKLSKKLKQN